LLEEWMDRRRALVTGAAQRLGRAMALDLAGSGWDVAVHYNGSAEAAAGTVGEARALGAQAVALQADLTVEAEVARLVGRAAEALGGPLSLLVNNASVFENDRLDTMTRASWDRGVETNLRAPVKLTQDFAAQAPRAGVDARGEPVAQAVVINMLDMRVFKPMPTFLSYFVAKSGLYAFTRAAAQALGPHVRIAGIGPGPTLAASNHSDEHFLRQRAACVLGRGSDPEDIVGAMRFILANKAFTGQMVAIDGGQHLSWKGVDAVATG
jgi:NAD(P)-dependent dehydrogenase (short-subunit alcohol dehydrogenase family)